LAHAHEFQAAQFKFISKSQGWAACSSLASKLHTCKLVTLLRSFSISSWSDEP
jgi:hypothetical protein